MAAPGSEAPIVLYHYSGSPYARRVVWYLRLRGIPYVQCPQPPIFPRPDVARLGIKYRRIPLLSIGRDVYLDTRLILRKLEQLHTQKPRLGAAPGTDALALERLLEILHVDAGVFFSAAALLPADLPWMRDPKFQADRADFFGRPGAKGGPAPPADPNAREAAEREAQARRAEYVGEIRRAFELLETTLLADGRTWLLGTPGPSLADIEAIWPLHWLTGLPGALPPDVVSARHFPQTFAWFTRFDAALAAAGETGADGKPAKAPRVSGAEAQEAILRAPYHEPAPGVDADDPFVQALGLTRGQQVTVWPTDSGVSHRDTGRLIGIDVHEVVFETVAGSGAETVRVHAPRHGFRLRPAVETGTAKL